MIATSKQIDFVETLRDRLKLSADWFSGYCTATYGGEPKTLDTRSCSALITELLDWVDHPDVLLRVQGQAPLFEVPS